MNYEQNSVQKSAENIIYHQKRHLINEEYNWKKQVYGYNTNDEKKIFLYVQIKLKFRHVLSKSDDN